MHYSQDFDRLRTEVDTKECDIPADERARMQAMLTSLDQAVKDFPSANLLVKVIYHPRSAVYHAEFKLKLPGKTLFAGEVDTYLDRALDQCVRRQVELVESYKKHPNLRANEEAEQRAARGREMMAPEDADVGPLAEAAQNGDYRIFRSRLIGYEDWLRKRVGRWVQRYPEAQAQVGDGLLLGDLLEEVYLNAFESIAQRPTNVPLTNWLDSLIDPSLQALLRNPDEVHENASLARTVRQGP